MTAPAIPPGMAALWDVFWFAGRSPRFGVVGVGFLRVRRTGFNHFTAMLTAVPIAADQSVMIGRNKESNFLERMVGVMVGGTMPLAVLGLILGDDAWHLSGGQDRRDRAPDGAGKARRAAIAVAAFAWRGRIV